MNTVDDKVIPRMWSGMQWGLIVGAVFGVFALVNALFHGGTVKLRGGERAIPLVHVLGLYLVLGPLTGSLFGLFLPWMRKSWAAGIIGALISLPIGLYFSFIINPDTWPADRPALIIGTSVGVLFGIFGAMIVRDVSDLPDREADEYRT